MADSNTVTDFDAIVVGSGISGGWAAKELTEKGFKVLILERGEPVREGRDYLGEHAPDWKLPFNGKEDRQQNAEQYPIQSKNYAFSAATKQFFNNDKQNPYSTSEGRPFEWYRADVVGGRSLTWGRQCYRFSEQDFQANASDKSAAPWPIDYKALAPWYSHVEKFIGVSGQAEGLNELPDSEFLPAMGKFALEETIQARLKKKAPDVKLTMGRTAILTQDHMGRSACHYCGPCHRGCSTRSYFSSHSSTLPAAKATGNLTLKSNSVVERLVYDAQTERVTHVEVIESDTRERKRYSAKMFFLCASTLGSTQIMLNSKSEKFPTGLANSSGVLGHYLMDHFNKHAAFGLFFDDMNSYFWGDRPNGMYIPRFRNLADQQDPELDFVRGYGFQANVRRLDWRLQFNQKGFGASFKEKLRKPGPWVWALTGFLECLPQYTNQASLHPSKVDRFGIPQLHVEFSWSDNELKMYKDMLEQSERIMRAAGAVYWAQPKPSAAIGGSAIHEMGTARMGDDPSQSVLNAHNQAHDVANLFVTDGASMASSSCVNPSLTYMALTARAVDYAASQIARGALV